MKGIIMLLVFIPSFGIGQSTDFSSKSFLKIIYSQAIADFIKAVEDKHKTKFDTLYFGKHVYGQPDDFPDIELPKTIENTQVRLIAPEDGVRKQNERKTRVYINMVGTIANEKAEFIFVTFSNGFEHQFDCYIDYKYHVDHEKFDPDQVRFQYYLYKNSP